MKYKIHAMDRRNTYFQTFTYYLKFSSSMTTDKGPLSFTQAQKWFSDTYGWSAEVSLYADLMYWNKIRTLISSNDIDIPVECNPHWSWAIGTKSNPRDLRIYVASESELAFFQLANPLDQ